MPAAFFIWRGAVAPCAYERAPRAFLLWAFYSMENIHISLENGADRYTLSNNT